MKSNPFNGWTRRALWQISVLTLISGSATNSISAQTSTLDLEVGVETSLPLDQLFEWAPTVLLETTQGTIPIELTPEAAPSTVENFLFYVDSGRYADSFIHRSASLQGGTPFVIQGGGFFFEDLNDVNSVQSVPTEPPVVNEFNVSNTRGTVAMAKFADDPDSATSQWFINLSDNGAILDDQNGGFTVFGRVVSDGMEVADAVSDLDIFNLNTPEGGPFGEVPLTEGTLAVENFVVIESADRFTPEVSVNFPEGGTDLFEIVVAEGEIGIEALSGASGNFVVELTASFLEGDPQVEVVELSVAPTQTWYDAAVELGDGWRFFSWFKGFSPFPQSNWIFHSRHGWLSVVGDDPDRLFLWDTAMQQWLYTNQTVYPYMYTYGPNPGWVFFFENGRPGARFFARADSGAILSEGELATEASSSN